MPGRVQVISAALFRSFCHKDHHALSKPWSIGEHSYASDGHILLRIPRSRFYKENPMAPDARVLPWDNHLTPTIIPAWPDDEENWRKINACKEGECFGAAFSDDGVLLQVRLVLSIQRLPGIVIEDRPTGFVGPIYFTFDGGDGFIMPMREKSALKSADSAP